MTTAKAEIDTYEVHYPTQFASIKIDDGSAQRSNLRSIVVTFDRPVTFTGAPALAFVLTRTSPGAPLPMTPTVSLDNSGPFTVVTLTFTGPGVETSGSLTDGKYELRILASGITMFDGDGDLAVGGDNILNFHRLFGDADGNGTVDSSDFAEFRKTFGVSGPTFDFDNNGVVNSNDFAE